MAQAGVTSVDDKAFETAKAAIAGKDRSYFAAHGLADLLGGAGAECGPDAIRALVRRLAEDDTYAFLFPISAGLREIAPDDDGFARLVSAVVGKMRPIPFQRPLVNVLTAVGRDRPAEAAGAAARLIELGDADYGAFMIGGAYGGAGRECDGLVEGLLSSGAPRDAAAALRALKVASAEHGLPDAGRIRAAVGRAMAHDDAEVQKEAMEALLGLCRRGDAAAEAMVESMALGRYDSRPVLAANIWRDSPFDDEKSLRYLRACMGYEGDRYVLHSVYWALAKIAGRRPGEVARMMIWMSNNGWYHSTLAGAVQDELGRSGAPAAAVAALLEALQRPLGEKFAERLESAVVRIARLAGRDEVAALVLGTIGERPAGLGPRLRVLSLLALDDWRNGGGPEFAEGVMSRLCALPAGAGGGAEGGERGPELGKIPSMPA